MKMRKFVNFGFIMLILVGSVATQASEPVPYALEVGEQRDYLISGWLYEKLNDVIYCNISIFDAIMNITVDEIWIEEDALHPDMVLQDLFMVNVNSTITMGEEQYKHESSIDGWIIHEIIIALYYLFIGLYGFLEMRLGIRRNGEKNLRNEDKNL